MGSSAWYKHMSLKFHNMAEKAAKSLECSVFLENALDGISMQLEEKLNVTNGATNEPCENQENDDPNVQQKDNLLSAARLKKKEVVSKNSRRHKTWLDKLHKRGKCKATKSAAPTKGAKQQKKNDDVQTLVEVENGGSRENTNVELQQHNVITSFTQFLRAPICDVASLLNQDMF